MADLTNTEGRPTLSQRDRALIKRHGKVAEEYAPGTPLANEWGVVRKEHIKAAGEIANTILSANILPVPLDSNDAPLIVSLSSFVGLNEGVLAEKIRQLGLPYRVIAGDISNVKRLKSKAIAVRFDASFLPLQKNSIAAMIDLQGAIWHEAYHDLKSGYNGETTSTNLLDIFTRLKPSLRKEGVIIVDDPQFFPNAAIGTTAKIDQLLRLTGGELRDMKFLL